jgi:hypothetical protein
VDGECSREIAMHSPAQIEGRFVRLEERQDNVSEELEKETIARKTFEEKVNDRLSRIEKILVGGFCAVLGWQGLLKMFGH